MERRPGGQGPLLSVDLLRHLGVEHQHGRLPPGDVQSDQGAVLSVQVTPDLQGLARTPGTVIMYVLVVGLPLLKLFFGYSHV